MYDNEAYKDMILEEPIVGYFVVQVGLLKPVMT
jgi:hypothetical protein